jgi:sec-independent protein translocase protein TatA
MTMFSGLHWPDLLIVVVLGLLVFGPKRLPELGSSVGKTIKEFQKSMREVNTHEEPATPALPASQAQQLPAASAPTTTATMTSASTPAEMVSEVKAE